MAEEVFWFRLFARQWLTDRKVRRLPRHLIRPLIDLWCHQCLDGPLPVDRDWLADLIGVELDDLDRLLGEFFQLTDRGWENPRMASERARAIRQTTAGKAAAAKRWSGRRNAIASPKARPGGDAE